ncbi:YbjN domain-containing protein [Pantanalinema rosaneae CENA516]|uniref:YbjN domain-containing protein n=1 Tax=Pantanalinema rosaneae TaxID=1620701 RepID=UPI003D6EFF74
MQDLNLSEAVAHPLARYRNHLEFNGYVVEEGDGVILCRHPRKPNLIVTDFDSRGVSVATVYNCDPDVKRLHLLEYLNELNAEFLFMKAYVDEENCLLLETFFEGAYDRTNFSILLENIEYDMARFFEHKLTEAYVE